MSGDSPAATASSGSAVVEAGKAPTVMSKSAVPVLPAASVALQVTVVMPIGKVLPEAGVQVGVRAPSTSSVALGRRWRRR